MSGGTDQIAAPQADRMPDDRATDERAPDDQLPAGRTLHEQAPGEQAPGEQARDDGAPGDGTPGTAGDTGTSAIDANLVALRRFLRAAEGHLPAERLATARSFVDRADARLGLSRRHAVVALAGTTGSGKSSIFNAVAGLPLSAVGVRRPTTGVAHACVWGADGSGALLDWLDIAPNRRFEQPAATTDRPGDAPAGGEPTSPGPAGFQQATLAGLVLLDLPDVDSMEEPHRAEVDRLLSRVDLVIWVLDPQKYADAVVHERYLRPAAGRSEVTVVVLNQVDTLGGADTARCVADLRQLLDTEGLSGMRLLATSTVEPGGLDDLRTLLAGTASAAGDAAGVRRLWVDLCDTVEGLAPLVAVAPADDVVDRATVRLLIDILANVCGVPSMVESFERTYRERATALIGWPVAAWTRWLATRLRLLRADPLELRQAAAEATAARQATAPAAGATAGPGPTTAAGATAGPEPGAPDLAVAQRAAADLAARELVDSAAGTLPRLWQDAAHAAALGRRLEVPAALDAAITGTGPGLLRQPAWWTTVRLVHRIAAATAAASLVWLVVAAVTGSGQVPPAAALLAGSLAVGLLLAVGLRPAVRYLAGRGRRRAELRLRTAVAEVASDLIVAPARVVLLAYQDARGELHAAYPGSSTTLDTLGR